MKVAILVDGAFYLHRHHAVFGAQSDPQKVAADLWTHCVKHVDKDVGETL